jgi:hypothetical protein
VARFSRILRTRATIIAEAAKSPNNILVSGIIIREMIDARTHAQILRFIQSENIVIQAYHGSDLSCKKPWSIASTGQPGNRVPVVEVKSREVTFSECGFFGGFPHSAYRNVAVVEALTASRKTAENNRGLTSRRR